MGRPSNAAKLAKALMESANKNGDQEIVKQPSISGLQNKYGDQEIVKQPSSPDLLNKNADQEILNQVNGNSGKKRALSVMRRSGRLHKKMFLLRSKMVNEEMTGEIRISDSEKEDEYHNIEPKSGLQELQKTGYPELPKTEDGRNLEEKVEYLLQAVDELKSKICNDQHPRNSPLKNVNCISSQTEIESLREENNQLRKKLDIALGKVEAYAEGNHTLIDTLKEVILSPNLAKTSKSVTLLLPSEEDPMARDIAPLKEPPVAKKRGRKPRQVVG